MRNLKKVLALVLALVMSLSLVTIANAADFSDAADIDYDEAVDVMVAAGIIDGVGNNSFDPNGTLTREQAAKLIAYMLLGENSEKLGVESTSFKDVAATRWSAPAIEYCATLGIIDGAGDGNFYPAGKLTGYAFAKMLLTALGYDSQVEEFVGNGWTINVATIGLEVGLHDGLDKMFGSAEITRQEAAQMALNAIKSPLVYYPNKGNTVSVNGVVVDFSSQKYEYVTTTIAKTQTISQTKLSNSEDYTIELGEKYLPNLRLRGGSDDFGRPADIWYWKSEKIGTYPDDADATYTKKVKVGDIYKDLNLSINVPVENVTIYEDGAEIAAAAIKKASTTEYGDNGVLAEVFYDDVNNTAIITLIHTYTATISRSVAASGNRDAYVILAIETSAPIESPSGVSGGTLNYETDEKFEDDARVLYTYSQSAEEVIDVTIPESVSGIVTRSENSNQNDNDKKALTIDGTRYANSRHAAGENVGDVTVKNDYTIYLDAYGYMIYVEETDVGIGNYALLIDTATTSTFIGNRARLLLTDGSIKNVETDKNYNGDLDYKPYTIVSFRVDDAGVYTLRPVDKTQSFMNATRTGTNGNLVDADYADAFALTSDKAGVTVDAAAKNYNGATVSSAVFNANSASVFVVADPGTTGNGNDFNAYTGIKNAPTISGASADTDDDGVAAYWFCKGANSKMITVMFIFPGVNITIEDGKSDLVFVAKNSASNLYHDADGDYYEYNAVVGSEIKENVKVDETVKINGSTSYNTAPYVGMSTDTSAHTKDNLNGLFKGSSVDKYGVITNLKPYTAYSDGSTEQYLFGVGVDKRSKDYTLILNTDTTASTAINGHTATETITADEKCEYYYVDKDGNITTSSYRGVAVDDNDLVYAIVKDYLVQVLVIEEVENPADTYQVSFTGGGVAKVDLTDSSGDPLATPVTGIAKDDSLTFTVTAKEGVSNVNVTANGGTLSKSGDTYTLSGITKNITVTITADGTPVVKKHITLVNNVGARISIDGERHDAGGEIELAEGSHDVTIQWGGTPAAGQVVYLNTDKQTKFSGSSGTDEYTITVADGDEVTVGVKTQKLTVPANSWKVAWDADTAKFIEARTSAVIADSGTQIDVPEGAVVTVDPDTAKATTHYFYNPEGDATKTDENGKMVKNGDLKFTMPNKAVTLTADKWFKVAANATVEKGATATNFANIAFDASVPVDFSKLVEGTAKVTVGTDTYVKAGSKVEVTVTVTEATEAQQVTGGVTVNMKSTMTGIASTTGAEVLSGTDAGTAITNNTFEITIASNATPAGGDITLALEAANS